MTSIRWLASLAVAVSIGPLQAAPQMGEDGAAFTVQPLPVRNANFDEVADARRACPRGWVCSMHADPKSFVYRVVVETGGNRHLQVTRVSPEPWALAKQWILVTPGEGVRLRLTIALNTEDTEGEAGPFLYLKDSRGDVVKHAQKLVKPVAGWQEVVLEIELDEPSIRSAEFGLLVEGGGTTLLDRVRLNLVSRKARPLP